MDIKAALDLCEGILKEKMPELDEPDRLHVEIAPTIDGYVLKHARGAMVVFYSGSVYPEKLSNGATVQLKRDIVVTVGVIVKYFVNRKLPAEYVDLAADWLSGYEIFSRRPASERKTMPVKDELVSEENYEWRYLLSMKIPAEFVTTDIREQV